MAALTPIQQSTVTSMKNVAENLIRLKAAIDVAMQLYSNEIYPTFVFDPTTTNEDVAALFPHLTVGEVTNCAAALQALQAWGGDLSSGNWGALLRMLDGGL